MSLFYHSPPHFASGGRQSRSIAAIVRQAQRFPRSAEALPRPFKSEPGQVDAPRIERKHFGHEIVHAFVDERSEHQLFLRAGAVANEKAIFRQAAAERKITVMQYKINSGKYIKDVLILNIYHKNNRKIFKIYVKKYILKKQSIYISIESV